MISVLLIDDDPEMLEIISLLLGSEGDFAIQTCISPGKAIELAQAERFDSIVCDFYMPEMDGSSLLQHLRSRGCTSQLILFSGKDHDNEIKHALASGVDGYVQRRGNPVAEIHELKRIIRTTSP